MSYEEHYQHSNRIYDLRLFLRCDFKFFSISFLFMLLYAYVNNFVATQIVGFTSQIVGSTSLFRFYPR